jgi:hypothetical protein
MTKKPSNPLKFFNDKADEKVKNMQTGGAVAGVINDYTKKAAYGKPGGPSYVSRNPAPSFKNGGAKKKK